MAEALLAVHIEALLEGGFLDLSEDLPGLVAQGGTVAETLEIAQDVACKPVKSYREHADALPPALQGGAAADFRIPVNVA